LNFGVFKHPGGGAGLPAPVVPSDTSVNPTTSELADKDGKKAKMSRNDNTTVVQKLEALGMKCVSWAGKCEADKVSVGKFDVLEGEGGMYGLVFDNTFSKQVSKTATFVLMTHPTNAPPTSGHHLHFSHQASAATSSTSLPRGSPALGPAVSTDSLPHEAHIKNSVAVDPRPRSKHATESKSLGGSTFYTGIMHKRRRKHNTYAKRFFSLDFTTGTLSYYQNRHSSALRGAIPLSLAAVGTNERTREISVDSGAEIWHLRVRNQRDFSNWRDALERASRVVGSNSTVQPKTGSASSDPAPKPSIHDIREWERIETLVGKVSGIRDAVRRLAKDTDPKYLPSSIGNRSAGVSPTRTPSEGSFEFSAKDDEQLAEKRPFWKRKASSGAQASPSLFKRSVSSQLVPLQSTTPIAVPSGQKPSFPGKQHLASSPDSDAIHGHCMELLRDLDQVVSEFSTVILESKKRIQPLNIISRRQSSGSISSDEFFDAQDGEASRSQLLQIRRDSQEFDEHESFFDGESDTSEEMETIQSFVRRRTTEEGSSLFPAKAKNLSPLPLSPVRRRHYVQPPKQPPPSLIAFLRKNVGKDFANIAMPASANEPTSGLQRIAEQLEYSELLDAAAVHTDPSVRLLHIAAFAISSFSNNRVKERAIRKPFNPMLGETFELIREDKGYRLLSEKISHKPVRMAIQAESSEWTFVQASSPTQKFWGKSAELNTEGQGRVILHNFSEVYSYTLATSFLRNVIAGEKYIEPVSTMTILNESSGTKAVVTFKAGGMFAGRSEEVSVQAFDAKGLLVPEGLAGKWTSHLNITTRGQDSGNVLWKVGDLSDAAILRYGFTAFAAQMNEITEIERGKLPRTDSRLRPDQKAVEEGNLDLAEGLKAKLEERQRGRRRVMEDHAEEWKPKWFVKTGNDGEEDIWKLKTGRDSYWEERSRGEWAGVVDVFET
jgi:oxysterol-binding protein-related protein 3/6/7